MSFTNLKRECPVCDGTIVQNENPIATFCFAYKSYRVFANIYRRHFHDVTFHMSHFSNIGTLSTSIDAKINKNRNELDSVPSVGMQPEQLEQPRQLSLFEGGDDAL